MPNLNVIKDFRYRVSCSLAKAALSFLGYLPPFILRSLGRVLGTVIYATYAPYRKRTLSNLFCCPALSSKSPEELKVIAKKSLQRLCITMLEYGRLSQSKNIQKIAYCENPEVANTIMSSGKGIIFFCGHLSNWEVLFLEGTSRMPGIAIGRPITNHYLYKYIVSIREKFGGTVVEPKNALKECLRALRQGKFVGIVGDQGLPESEYKGQFLGRMAYTSNAPALLSIKTGSPVIVATVRFDGQRYAIHYGDPIYPQDDIDPKKMQTKMMDEMMLQFETKILGHPEDWLWSHNRWKLHKRGSINHQYRHDSILLTLPEESIQWSERFEKLYLLRRFFPHEIFGLQLSQADPLLQIFENDPSRSSLLGSFHLLPYSNETELFALHPRFKLHLDASSNQKLQRHLTKTSAFQTLDVKELFSLPLEQFKKQLEETLYAT